MKKQTLISSFFLCLLMQMIIVVTPIQGASTGQTRGSTLSKDKLENTLNRWVSSTGNSGSVTVIGIQENPQNNTARADIRFTNFTYNIQGFGGRVEQKVFSGGGLAHLIKYNDGRWVLSSVYTNQGMNSRWWEGINQVIGTSSTPTKPTTNSGEPLSRMELYFNEQKKKLDLFLPGFRAAVRKRDFIALQKLFDNKFNFGEEVLSPAQAIQRLKSKPELWNTFKRIAEMPTQRFQGGYTEFVAPAEATGGEMGSYKGWIIKFSVGAYDNPVVKCYSFITVQGIHAK